MKTYLLLLLCLLPIYGNATVHGFWRGEAPNFIDDSSGEGNNLTDSGTSSCHCASTPASPDAPLVLGGGTNIGFNFLSAVAANVIPNQGTGIRFTTWFMHKNGDGDVSYALLFLHDNTFAHYETVALDYSGQGGFVEAVVKGGHAGDESARTQVAQGVWHLMDLWLDGAGGSSTMTIDGVLVSTFTRTEGIYTSTACLLSSSASGNVQDFVMDATQIGDNNSDAYLGPGLPTPTPTFTGTYTVTPTPTFTGTPTFTDTSTVTPTSTITPTSTVTPTFTNTPFPSTESNYFTAGASEITVVNSNGTLISFTAQTTRNLKGLALYARKTGSPIGSLRAYIYPDSNNSPNCLSPIQRYSFPPSTVGSTLSFVPGILTSGSSNFITAGNRYWISAFDFTDAGPNFYTLGMNANPYFASSNTIPYNICLMGVTITPKLIFNLDGVPATYTPTQTSTKTPSLTITPLGSASATSTFSRTATPSPTFTVTSSYSVSPTITNTKTPRFSSTNTPVPATATSSRTQTSIVTLTPRNTPSSTSVVVTTNTFTRTSSKTETPRPSATKTFTVSSTITITYTKTITLTPTISNTFSVSPTKTATKTVTKTGTPSVTKTFSHSPTITPTSRSSSTFTKSPTFTNTFTASPTSTITTTKTASPTFTITPTSNPVTGYYRGEPDHVQGFDSSGSGNTMAINGNPGNPTSPTPPDGVRWLFGNSATGSSFGLLPNNVITDSRNQWLVEAWVRSTGTNGTLILQFDDGDVNGAVIQTEVVGPSYHLIVTDFISTTSETYELTTNTDHLIRIEGTGNTAVVIIDGVNVGSVVGQFMFDPNNTSEVFSGLGVGSGNSSVGSYLDALMIASSASAVYLGPGLPTPTATITPTFTKTATPRNTATATSTETKTATPTKTVTQTSTVTQRFTSTFTSNLVTTATLTATPTKTHTPRFTSTDTPTFTITRTFTITQTQTGTTTKTSSVTPTYTATVTKTSTVTKTATSSFSNSPTITKTRTITKTSTHSATNTPSPTFTVTPSNTPASGEAYQSWKLANDVVHALTITANALYIGGDFTSVGGNTALRLAAMSAVDGSFVSSWAPSIDTPGGSVLGMAVLGSTIYVVGNFSSVNGGVTRHNAAAFDRYTGECLAWNPDLNNQATSVAIMGSTIYITGFFTTAGGTSRIRAAAFNTAGTLLGWNPNLNSTGNKIFTYNSTVYIGGSFTQVNGSVARNGAAAFDATVGTVNSWDPGLTIGPDSNLSVQAISLSSRNTLYIGGAFSGVQGAFRNNAAEVSASTGIPTTWNPSLDGPVNDIQEFNNVVYLGGEFASAGGGYYGRAFLAAVKLVVANILSWDPNPDNIVYGISAFNNNPILVGGAFLSIGNFSPSVISAIGIAAVVPPTTQLATPNITPTDTDTFTPTNTPTATPTFTKTITRTNTPTFTGTPTSTNTPVIITFDAQTSGTVSGASSLTFAHTTSGTDPVLIVWILYRDFGGSDTCTYNGVSMTKYQNVASGAVSMYLESFILLNPPTGAHNVVFTGPAGTYDILGVAASYNGASISNASISGGTLAQNATSSSSVNITTSVANSLITDAVGADGSITDTVGGSQTLRKTLTFTGGSTSTLFVDDRIATTATTYALSHTFSGSAINLQANNEVKNFP